MPPSTVTMKNVSSHCKITPSWEHCSKVTSFVPMAIESQGSSGYTATPLYKQGICGRFCRLENILKSVSGLQWLWVPSWHNNLHPPNLSQLFFFSVPYFLLLFLGYPQWFLLCKVLQWIYIKLSGSVIFSLFIFLRPLWREGTAGHRVPCNNFPYIWRLLIKHPQAAVCEVIVMLRHVLGVA